jgi:hypothetical protein
MKTKEEKLQEKLNNLPYEKHVDDGQFNDGSLSGFESGFNAGVEFAESWIPVEEELPNCSPYLAIDKQGKVELFNITEQSFIKAVGIISWRPLNRK